MRIFACFAASVVFASVASAQVVAPLQMPGTTVGMARPIVQPVGTRQPQAVPQAGTPITGLATSQQSTITQGGGGNVRPQGTPIDMSNVIAPYPGMPKESTFWERLEERWFSLFESDMPAVRANYTPGIARRNKERKEERMARNWWE